MEHQGQEAAALGGPVLHISSQESVQEGHKAAGNKKMCKTWEVTRSRDTWNFSTCTQNMKIWLDWGKCELCTPLTHKHVFVILGVGKLQWKFSHPLSYMHTHGHRHACTLTVVCAPAHTHTHTRSKVLPTPHGDLVRSAKGPSSPSPTPCVLSPRDCKYSRPHAWGHSTACSEEVFVDTRKQPPSRCPADEASTSVTCPQNPCRNPLIKKANIN